MTESHDMLPHHDRGPGGEPVSTIPNHDFDSDMNPYIGLSESKLSRFSEEKTWTEKFLDIFK